MKQSQAELRNPEPGLGLHPSGKDPSTGGITFHLCGCALTGSWIQSGAGTEIQNEWAETPK